MKLPGLAFLLLVAACTASSPSLVDSPRWPLNVVRSRVLVDEGVSVLMPPSEGWPESTLLVQKPLGVAGPVTWQLPLSAEEVHARDERCWRAPEEAHQPWIFDARCDWANPSDGRSIYVGVRRSLASPEGAEEASLEAARQLLGDKDIQDMTRLNRSSCRGVQYSRKFEGQPVKRRLCLAGDGVIVLSASSAPEDAFPEADVVFDTLQVSR